MTALSADPSSDSRSGGLKLALLVCGIDVLLIGSVALSSNSVTILSDALKEAAEFLAVLAAFLTVRAVSKAPSERFAYGVGKLENLVSMGIGVLMLGCALFIVNRALVHIEHPVPAEGTLPGIVVFTVYAGIGFVMWTKNRIALREHHSAIVESQAHLWFSKAMLDALMALALSLALVFGQYAWSLYLDPIAALVGAGFLVYGAWAVTSSSVSDLLDATLEETLQLLIMRQMVEHFESYQWLHGIRARRSGPQVYIELFLEFAPELPVGEVHRRAELIRADLGRTIPGSDVSICLATEPPKTLAR